MQAYNSFLNLHLMLLHNNNLHNAILLFNRLLVNLLPFVGCVSHVPGMSRHHGSNFFMQKSFFGCLSALSAYDLGPLHLLESKL